MNYLRLQFVAAALLAAPSAFAQQAPKPEQLIKWRQSVYQSVAWNVNRIKSNVDGQYNKDDVVRAATLIAATANAGLGTLFPAGTDSGKGWHETTVKPSFFTDTQGVATASAAFAKEANELLRVAQTGDAGTVKAQFGTLQKTCKSCHDSYRSSN